MLYFNDATLEHAGVKGMKWGVRRAAKREATRQNDLSIVSARIRQEKRAGGLTNAAAKTYATTSKKGQAAALKTFERVQKQYLTNPDAATSEKLTSGEKATRNFVLSLYGVSAALTVASIVGSAKA